MKKRKYCNKRRRDASTSNNSSSSEENHWDVSKQARFETVTDNVKFEWKLPKSMVNYANKCFE